MLAEFLIDCLAAFDKQVGRKAHHVFYLATAPSLVQTVAQQLQGAKLAGEAADVKIVGEALLRVRHSLIAASDTPLEEIDTVITHPHVPGQCTRFLRGELRKLLHDS